MVGVLRCIAACLACMVCAACVTPNPSPNVASSLPPGASYLQPFASGVSPARMYAASVSQVGSNLTAYDLLPICTTDFQTSALLKGLTSTPTLNYGSISLSDGAVVVANLSGVPIGNIINAGGGVSSDQRVNVTLENAQLIQVDNDGVDSLIAKYVKDRGHGTAINPRCLDVVQTQLKAGRMVIVTKGVLTSLRRRSLRTRRPARTAARRAQPGPRTRPTRSVRVSESARSSVFPSKPRTDRW